MPGPRFPSDRGSSHASYLERCVLAVEISHSPCVRRSPWRDGPPILKTTFLERGNDDDEPTAPRRIPRLTASGGGHARASQEPVLGLPLRQGPSVSACATIAAYSTACLPTDGCRTLVSLGTFQPVLEPENLHQRFPARNRIPTALIGSLRHHHSRTSRRHVSTVSHGRSSRSCYSWCATAGPSPTYRRSWLFRSSPRIPGSSS
jgi:hypothetical protein